MRPSPATSNWIAPVSGWKGAGGPYRLNWGRDHLVTVAFVPETPGAYECAVAVGATCGDSIRVRGIAFTRDLPPPEIVPQLRLFAISAPGDREQRLAYDLPARVFDPFLHHRQRGGTADRPLRSGRDAPGPS